MYSPHYIRAPVYATRTLCGFQYVFSLLTGGLRRPALPYTTRASAGSDIWRAKPAACLGVASSPKGLTRSRELTNSVFRIRTSPSIIMLKMSQKKHFGLALPDFSCKIAASTRHRAVAQAGSALRSGRRGRRFESCQLG